MCDAERVIADFDAELWVWDARRADTWTFVTVPADVAEAVRDVVAVRRGFGSVRVRVAVGTTQWSTSIFPDTRGGGYVLPVKRAVRVAERLSPDDVVSVRIELADL